MTDASRLPSGVGPGTVIGQHYRLVRPIGEGGMGIVFEAEGPNGARVALKLLVANEGAAPSAEARARFMRESNVSLNLRAAHVVAVHDHGVDAPTNLPFMVMDLLTGEDLESLVGRIGPLHPDAAVKLFLQACEGLEAAHDMGVVHRDVKPSNLFLCTLPGGRVDVRVCDFGAAKIFGGQALTHAGAVVGTPLFIAPEQLRSARDADARADVWSLGMSLYFALAGVAALEHVRSFGQLVTVLTTGEIPHLQKAAPWVPAPLARVVHATLLVKPEARCPSVRDLATALARLEVPGDLATSALVPLDDAMRAVHGEPAALATHWSEVVATLPAERTAPTRAGNAPAPDSAPASASAPASESASAPASAPARAWIFALVALLVVVLGAVLRLVILRP